MRHLRSLLAILLAACPLAAQLVPGDIGVTGFSTNAFGVISPSGAATGYVTTGFQGTGSATSQWILWDPAVPDSFIVGGFGFIGRATVTGPGTSTYALITNGISQVTQMSWDNAGQLIVGDQTTDQVHRVDPATGTITPITSGAQPWGATTNAAAFDPATGDIYVGNGSGVYRVPAGTATGVALAPALGSYVSAITFDPVTGEAIATVLNVNRFVRISAAGAVTDIIPQGTITGMNAVDVDNNGDFIVGHGAGQVRRIPYAGGAPVLIGTNTSPSTNVSGLSVVRSNSVFEIVVTPVLGGGTVDIRNIPAPTTEGWTFLSLDTALPLGAGPVFGITPDALTFLIFTAFPVAAPGDPFHWTYSTPPPAVFPGVPFVVPQGTIATGTTIDFIAIAVDGSFAILPTAPFRASF